MAALLVTVSILLSVSNGRVTEGFPTIGCSYYSDFTYTDSPFQTQAIAMDVCRTYVVSGTPTYRMYTCDGTDIFDSVYSTDDCSGDPDSVETVTSNAEDSECAMDATIPCQYIMMKTPCVGDTYDIIPVIAEICIVEELSAGRTYRWECDPVFKKGSYPGGECGKDGAGETVQLSANLTVGQCLDAYVQGVNDNGAVVAYEPQTECIDIIYGPTQSPTMEPTLNPTNDPTPMPTTPTMEPTIEPTEATASPSEPDSVETDAASFISVITNYIFVAFTISCVYFI